LTTTTTDSHIMRKLT